MRQRRPKAGSSSRQVARDRADRREGRAVRLADVEDVCTSKTDNAFGFDFATTGIDLSFEHGRQDPNTFLALANEVFELLPRAKSRDVGGIRLLQGDEQL